MKRNQFLLTFLIGIFTISLAAQKSNAQKSGGEERQIRLDYNQATGKLNTMFKECIGAGRANEGLRADWQQQLAMVKKECDFKFIRMHGLLTDDMGVYREDKNGKPEYNYQYIDVLYDFILSIGMKPFVELGFMPSAMASGPQTNPQPYPALDRTLWRKGSKVMVLRGLERTQPLTRILVWNAGRIFQIVRLCGEGN